MTNTSLSIIFIVDGERLEAQSLLLVSSLFRQHRANPGVSLIAYMPAASFGQLSPATRAMYDSCGVSVRALRDPAGLWKKDYPHGNKLLALAEPRGSDASLFLDTDMVCLGRLDDLDYTRTGTVFAVPEGVPTWGQENDRWERAYAFFDLPLPEDRVQLMRRGKVSYYPYFNAGFIGVSEEPLRDGKRFGQLWLETASLFDWKCAVAKKRPWLDQITLPLTIKRFGLRYEALPEEYNYSISNRADLSGLDEMRLLHYHRARFLTPAPQYASLREDALAMIPPALHAEAERLLLQAHYLPPGDGESEGDDSAAPPPA